MGAKSSKFNVKPPQVAFDNQTSNTFTFNYHEEKERTEAYAMAYRMDIKNFR